MGEAPVLTIAVPIYNMDWCLAENLRTYSDRRLVGQLEVICLNNASEDRSKEIIQNFVAQQPEIFQLEDRDSRGYGSSINAALAMARGRYFRIIDADDWVNTEELCKQVHALQHCIADVVLTDYEIVSQTTGERQTIRARELGIVYEKEYVSFEAPRKTLPSIHCTTYRTGLLRESGFYMQDKIFFVDEEYIILPYLHAKSVIYYPYNVYRYQVANPEQSTSPKNRAKYQEHREKVLKRLIESFKKAQQMDPDNPALPYCRERMIRGIGDHFTTLLMYVADRKEGKRLAERWESYVKKNIPEFWPAVKKKAFILYRFNSLGVSLERYEKMKRKLGIGLKA